MTSNRYNTDREAYWEAQRKFRATAVAEIQGMIPEGYRGLTLEMGFDQSSLHLQVCALIPEGGGEPVYMYEGDDDMAYFDWDEADQIATEMEVLRWEDADSFLDSDGGDRFIIEAD